MSLLNNIENPFQTHPEHNLFKMFINEYESMLTIGRSDEGLEPYDLDTQIQFVKNQTGKFISTIQNMVLDYLLDDELADLDNPELDWIREYFYENEKCVFEL